MRKSLMVFALLCFGSLLQPFDATAMPPTASHTKITPKDSSFLREATMAGAAEVALAKLALQQTHTPQVQQLARRIVDDHTRTNHQLAEFDSRYAMKLAPTATPAAEEKSAKLKSLHDADFDAAFADTMVTDHRKAITLYSNAAQHGSSAIRRFAQATLPALKEHLEMARTLQAGGAPGNASGHMPRVPPPDHRQPAGSTASPSD